MQRYQRNYGKSNKDDGGYIVIFNDNSTKESSMVGYRVPFAKALDEKQVYGKDTTKEGQVVLEALKKLPFRDYQEFPLRVLVMDVVELEKLKEKLDGLKSTEQGDLEDHLRYELPTEKKLRINDYVSALKNVTGWIEHIYLQIDQRERLLNPPREGRK